MYQNNRLNHNNIVLTSYLKNLRKIEAERPLEGTEDLSYIDEILTRNKPKVDLAEEKSGPLQEVSNLDQYGLPKKNNKQKDKVVFDPENNTIKETVVKKTKNLHTTIYTLSEFFEIFAIMLEGFRKQNTMSACVSDLTQKISSRNTMVTSFIDPVSGRVDAGWNKFTIAVETFGKSEDTQTKKAHLLERFTVKTYQDMMPGEFKKTNQQHQFKTSSLDTTLAANGHKLPNMAFIPGHTLRDEFCQRITRILMEKHCQFETRNDGSWNLDKILFKYNSHTSKIQDKEIVPKCDDIYMDIILKTLKSYESPIRQTTGEELNRKIADQVEIRDKIEMIL